MTVDDDIARMILRRHNIQQLGFSYYETNRPPASNTPKPKRVGGPRPSRAGGYQFRPGYLAVELDLLAHTLAFAHAGLDIREARAA